MRRDPFRELRGYAREQDMRELLAALDDPGVRRQFDLLADGTRRRRPGVLALVLLLLTPLAVWAGSTAVTGIRVGSQIPAKGYAGPAQVWTDPTAPTGGGGGGITIGVGGAPTVSGSTDLTANRGAWTLSSAGTYDCKGFNTGRITVTAANVRVQNCRVNADGQYGIYVDNADDVTIRNNDIRNVHAPGDLNVITAFGHRIKILQNTAINAVTGDPGDSHTDFVQTWVSSSHPKASTGWEIRDNIATGPLNPSRNPSVPSIHQCIMAEGFSRGGNSGGDGGDPNNWIIAGNRFQDSWNQCIKLDGVDNVDITRNTFLGDSTKIMEVTTASSGVKYYSDNNATGGSYGSVGMTVTSGAGPA